MRRLLVALLVVPVLWTTVPPARGSGQTSDNAAADKVLIDSERRINEAIAKGDKAQFLTLVAEDGVWASGGGFVPVTLLGTFDQMSVMKWDFVNPQVLWINPTTAVVAYTWTGSGTILGRPLEPKSIASTIWTKRGDKWVAVYHQESDARTH